MMSSGTAKKVQILVLIPTRILIQVTHLLQVATLHLIQATLNPANKVKIQSIKVKKAKMLRRQNRCISARFLTSNPKKKKVIKCWSIHLRLIAALNIPMIRLSWERVVQRRHEDLHHLSKKNQVKNHHNQKIKNERSLMTLNQLKAKVLQRN